MYLESGLSMFGSFMCAIFQETDLAGKEHMDLVVAEFGLKSERSMGAMDKRRGFWSFLTEDLKFCCQMRFKDGK